MEVSPRTSIVVLVHETPKEARTAAESILRYTDEPFELVLVDNGSGSSTRTALRKLARELGAQLVTLEKNLGFSAGSNAGWRAARGREICLLNSDVVVTERWLTLLRAALHSAPDVGAVGPRSNFARALQGGIWLDDPTPKGVQEFGRFFNHHDPRRWFEPDWLMGFAILTRRAVLEAIDGFDESIPTFGGEDRDLCERMRQIGWRLICAGDTFVYHLGHRTFARADINRTATRLGRSNLGMASRASESERLVRASNGWVFEIADGVASHVETALVLRLMRADRTVESAAPGELEQLALGPPIGLCRADDGDDVWLLHRGGRRRVEGDPHRIRRLYAMTVAERRQLETLPEDEPVSVADALPPVSRLRPRLPRNPARIDPAQLVPVGHLTGEIRAALAEGRGYALIRLREAEAVALDEGNWRDATIPGELGAAVRSAIVRADAVGIDTARAVAPLLEKVLFHLDLYPRVRFALDAVPAAEFQSSLGLSRVAVVANSDRVIPGQLLGAAVTVNLRIDETTEVESCIDQLSALRGAYDAVLVAAGVAGTVLCPSAARALEVVAIDVGDALERPPHPVRRVPGASPAQSAAPFIVGAARSGTSLLALMLDSHPELAIPPETHFVSTLVDVWSRAEDPPRAVAEALITHSRWPTFRLEAEELRERLTCRSVNSPAEALRTFFQLYAEHQSKRRWGDKTPWYVLKMSSIADLLPEAHFIHVVRDGRDVALSIRDLWFGPSKLEEAARWWSWRVRSGRRLGASVSHYREVRYEQLVQEPEAVLRILCADLGLGFDSAMLHYYERADERLAQLADIGETTVGGRTVPVAERVAIHQHLRKAPDPTRIGRWRRGMTPDEQRRVFEVAGDLLQRLDYPVW